MKNGESLQQQAYFQWARLHPVAKAAFAIPNGGARSKITAAILKAEGVKPGVSDVFLPVPIEHRHGLWIEFKHDDGRPTKEQREFLEERNAMGYCCAVAWDAELAIKHTVRYLRGEVDPGEIAILKKVSARKLMSG